MKSIKAVIFDMDGLMIDSEPLIFQAYKEVFGKYSRQLSEKEYNQRYIGVSEADESKDMVVRFNLSISAEDLVLAKRSRYNQLLNDHLVAQPGLIELLTSLHQNGYKTAIGSSANLKNIKKVVDKLNISSLIGAYASAEEVKKGKPAPDVYLLAAKKLGVNPAECLVLEDAPKGVQAGKSAGMQVFAIPSKETKDQDFSQADKVLNSLSEVFELISL